MTRLAAENILILSKHLLSCHLPCQVKMEQMPIAIRKETFATP